MTDQTLRAVGELVAAVRPPGSFAARRTLSARHLVLEVEGVGQLPWPVPQTVSRQLCEIGRPARFGLGERTLLDPSVRHTWEVPRERVRIDEARWDRALEPVLRELREELGLPDERELSAELHSVLVYEQGQFFDRHRDSEKADGMLATLVVTLPSTFSGGEFVVEHGGERVVDRGSTDDLALVAFYADCEHEILAVTEGFRISLTYNLIARARTDAAPATPPPVPALAEHLRAHFATPVPVPPWRRNGGADTRIPGRLVYLLDHQYSHRGLAWDHLKGADVSRAETLVAAAGSADCEVALASVQVWETHAYEAFEDEEWMCGRRRRWELVDGAWQVVEETWEAIDGEDEPFDEPGEVPTDHPDRIVGAEFGESLGTEFTLSWWVDRAGNGCEPSVPEVSEDEICAGGGESEAVPFAYASEGYMGNEGNTVDRWYRRAAVVVWPRRDAAAPADATS